MDVARYSRLQFEGGAEREGRRRNVTTLDVPEAEGAVQESKAYRYWSGEAMALERKRDFRRIRVHPLQPSRDADSNSSNLSAFIPVGSHESEKVIIFSFQLFMSKFAVNLNQLDILPLLYKHRLF
jgi:hypothetical protein